MLKSRNNSFRYISKGLDTRNVSKTLKKAEYYGVESLKGVELSTLQEIFSQDVNNFSTFFSYASHVALKKIRNKIHSTKGYDEAWESSLQYGWQEAFKLFENRPDRQILALDVNSQYPYAMSLGGYTNPKYMKRYKVKSISDLAGVDNGIVLVKFDIKDEWFKSIFPHYMYDDEGKKYFKYTQLDYIWLSVSELKAYLPYLANVEPLWLISSLNSIEHPLAGTVKHFYKKRLEYKGTNYEKIIKNFLVAIHSATNPRDFHEVRVEIDDYIKLNSYLYKNNILCSNPDEIELFLGDNKTILKHIPSSRYIPPLTAEIYSKSRLIIFKLIEFLHINYPDVELCYINIDGIQLSIDRQIYDKILNSLKDANLIGSELGQYKIEAEADIGVWTAPGRYYLLKDRKLVKKADISLRDEEFNYLDYKYLFVKDRGQVIAHRHKAISGNNYKYVDENYNFIRPDYASKIDIDKLYDKNKKVGELLSYLRRITRI